MRGLGKIGEFAGRFGRARGGNFGMMAAIIAPGLMLASGYGLNIAQLTMVRSNLLSALDSAVTSTARDLTTGVTGEDDARARVEAFLLANGTRGFASTERISLDRLEVDRIASTISASASVEVDFVFPIFSMNGPRKVSVESAAIYSNRRIEVAMMLDVTGSMSGSKIRDLKAAAIDAVTALTENQSTTDPRVRIALVPYSDGVNVGALAERVVFREKEGGWDLPPHIDATRTEIRNNTDAWKDNCATERRDENFKPDFSDDGPDTVRVWPYDPSKKKRYLAKVNRDDRLNECARAVLTPLTADTAALKRQIESFSIAGYTGGGTGVQWTYYMLSHKWRKVIREAGLGDGPADPDPREVAKVAILMTDGEFNTAHADVVGDKQAVRRQGRKARSNAEAICDRMKADGIEIFTIGFKLNNRNARDVMANCASPDVGSMKRYYETSTGEELTDAFVTIARNIEALALTR